MTEEEWVVVQLNPGDGNDVIVLDEPNEFRAFTDARLLNNEATDDHILFRAARRAEVDDAKPEVV